MKKLSLTVETLRTLDGAEAQQAQGGQINTYQTCMTGCNTAQLASMCVCVFTLKFTCDGTSWAK